MRNRIVAGLTAIALVFTGSIFAGASSASASPTSPSYASSSKLKGNPSIKPSASANKRLAGPYYVYNTAYQNVTTGTYDGLFSYMTVQKPYINSGVGGDAHSLAELAVIQYDGVNNVRQIIEIGWTVDPGLNGGSTDPHLFTGAWRNDVFLGFNAAGGLVDNPANPINAGSSLATAIGASKAFDIRYTGGSWYVTYDNVAVGLFPGSIWSGSGVTFTSGEQMQGFGEIGSWNDPTPCTDMGNGLLATPTNASARISSWNLFPVGGSGWTPGTQSLSTNPAFAGAWTTVQSSISGVPSTTSMRYGGPGANAAGTAAGTQGSC